MFKKLPKFLFLFLSVFIALILLGVAVNNFFQARSDASQQITRFVIPKGQALSIIAERLEEEKLIKNKWAFRFAVYKNDLANKIQAGSFELSASMNTWEIAQALTMGTDDTWITLPEGWRREEIAESLSKQGLNNFKIEEFLNLSKGLEGQLFPDTYLVPREITSAQILSLLKNTFATKVTSALSEELADSQMSLNEVLTLASLVQRESANDAEMSLVAQILMNRLDINMPLQVDATLQYIKGYKETEKSWWQTPLAEDKKLDSLYNTYKYPGLPPGPICNPGISAIQAVLKPTSTKALYYIHDKSGKIHTADTLEDHNSNVNKYLR
jgi:UPF0755 protein